MTRPTRLDFQSQLGELTSSHEKLEERRIGIEANSEAMKNALESLAKPTAGGIESFTRQISPQRQQAAPSNETDRPASVVAMDNLPNKENNNFPLLVKWTLRDHLKWNFIALRKQLRLD